MSVFEVDQAGELVRRNRGFARISGLEAVGQDLRIYLRLRQGEIPTRTDLGIAWGPMLQSGVSEALLAEVVGQAALTRPGIVTQSTRVDVDRLNRSAVVSIECQVDLLDQRRRAALTEQVTITG